MTIILLLTLWFLGLILLWPGRTSRGDRSKVINDLNDIDIIIPARNEENNIPIILHSLINHNAIDPSNILVVNDSSTDATSEKAKEFKVKVHDLETLPSGWTGKTWACHRGAMLSKGKYLLFVDSDVTFGQNGIKKIGEQFDTSSALSVAPYHTVYKWYEQLSAFFNLIMIMGVGPFCKLKFFKQGLFGQIMMISKEIYERVGTHQAVRSEVLENLAFADILHREKVPISSLSGHNIASFRMFPGGYKELYNGWKKAFSNGAAKTDPVLLILIITWIFGAVLAFIRLLISVINLEFDFAILTLYSLYVLQITYMFRRIGSFKLSLSLFYFIPCFYYFYLFFISLTTKITGSKTPWKGRAV